MEFGLCWQSVMLLFCDLWKVMYQATRKLWFCMYFRANEVSHYDCPRAFIVDQTFGGLLE